MEFIQQLIELDESLGEWSKVYLFPSSGREIELEFSNGNHLFATSEPGFGFVLNGADGFNILIDFDEVKQWRYVSTKPIN